MIRSKATTGAVIIYTTGGENLRIFFFSNLFSFAVLELSELSCIFHLPLTCVFLVLKIPKFLNLLFSSPIPRSYIPFNNAEKHAMDFEK